MGEITPQRQLIVVAGPTAVGKTGVAIKLARHFDTDVVSADSRQIFREMKIGTAKPSPSEMAEAKHHFVDSHSITENYDAAQYAEEALHRINELFFDHEKVILCGGSGLYVRAVTEGFDDIPEIDPEIREELRNQYGRFGLEWLQEQMRENDPAHFEVIDQKNPHRLMRALEVKLGTGQSISVFRQRKKREHSFDIIKIGLERPREELYQKIDDRMDAMIREGLFEEALGLYAHRHHNALQTVGYQEIFDFMDGEYDRDEAIRLLKRNSRRYAKRQLTWFKRDPEMTWFHPADFNNIVQWILNPEEKKNTLSG